MHAFEEIYKTNEWGFGSGHGSLYRHVHEYCRLIERFIREHHITSVVDVGCGDWQFSRHIDWGGCHYTGCDVVGSVVELNRQRFTSPNLTFQKVSGDPSDLPSGDLMI